MSLWLKVLFMVTMLESVVHGHHAYKDIIIDTQVGLCLLRFKICPLCFLSNFLPIMLILCFPNMNYADKFCKLC